MLTTESPGRRRWRQLRAGLIGLLVSALAATACDDHADRTSQSTQRLAPTTQASAPVIHSSWPTSGWRTAAPQDHGINPSVLAGIDDQAKTAFPGLRSVLVVRHGLLVVERYYHGSTATKYRNVFSVTKSVTSALVGIALGDRQLTSLHQTVGELLGRHLPANADPAMAKVTLEQLLTMTAGIPADPEHGDALPAMFTSRDWVRFVLSQPLGSRPGTRFAYSTQGSQLLSAIVTDATGQSLLAFARAKLFTPLGIGTHPAFTPEHQSTFEQARFAWSQDPPGLPDRRQLPEAHPPGPRQVRLPLPQQGAMGGPTAHPGSVCAGVHPNPEPTTGSRPVWLPLVGGQPARPSRVLCPRLRRPVCPGLAHSRSGRGHHL